MFRRVTTVSLKTSLNSSDGDSGSLLQKILTTSDSNGDTYAKGDSKDEEVIRITNKGQTYSFKMESFRGKLRKLREKWNVDIRSLGEDRKCLDEIIQIMQWLYHDQKTYSRLMKEIRSTFDGVKNPQPETVAARFIGCFGEESGSLPNKGCDPSCASSLPPTSDVKNYSPCEDIVLHFKNQEFLALNLKNTEHAYIWIESDDKFTQDHVNRLKDEGITRVTLLINNSPDGSRKEVKGPMSVDNLVSNTTTSENSTTNGWAIAFIIILIILLILVLSLFYYGGFN